MRKRVIKTPEDQLFKAAPPQVQQLQQQAKREARARKRAQFKKDNLR